MTTDDSSFSDIQACSRSATRTPSSSGNTFFDRSPRNFDAILGLYRNGKLHLPAGVRKIHKDQVNHVKAPGNSEALYFSQCIFAGLRPGFL